jgi:hypothetical protein
MPLHEQRDQRLCNGTRVHAVCRVVDKGDYTTSRMEERARYDGKIGVIAAHSDRHGLCYEVRFADGTAWFDPEELAVLGPGS